MDTLTLTYWQRRRLEQQLKSTHDARAYRRTLAVPSVASRLRVSARSVSNWLAAYAQDRDRPADRHRPRPGPLVAGGLPTGVGLPLRHLDRAPAAAVPGTSQRRPGLGGHLRQQIQRLGYAWKRPRHRLGPSGA
jgi:hypothetical protein